MIGQLKKVDHIYDLLALCSSYIFNEIVQTPYEFGMFNDNKYDEVYDAIETYCYSKKAKGYQKAFEELRSFVIDFLELEINIERCYAIVRYIDELVDTEIIGGLLEDKGIVRYTSLNKQYRNQVRIIPKLKETFSIRGDKQFRKNSNSSYSLFRKNRKCACSVLDSETLNYMIWDKRIIDKYPMSIYHLEAKNPIAKHFFEREKIVLGIVPFTNKELGKILNINFEQKCFYVEGMKEEEEIILKERYLDIYERSKNEDIDFLAFPEMLMTNNIISSIQNKENNNSPQFIVNGSIWKDNINKTIITDGKGNEILHYCKKEPFLYKKDNEYYKEYLEKSCNKEYYILEIDKIGRIGVCICKDLVNEDVKLFHKYIGTNLLIVPSYTNSLDLMSAAEELSKDYNCIVVVVNACSAFNENNSNKENKRKIGFITVPAKKDSGRSETKKIYYNDYCIENCEKGCVGKIISIEFLKTHTYVGGISYLIQESTF